MPQMILHDMAEGAGFQLQVLQEVGSPDFIGAVHFRGGRRMFCIKDSASAARLEAYQLATANVTQEDLNG